MFDRSQARTKARMRRRRALQSVIELQSCSRYQSSWRRLAYLHNPITSTSLITHLAPACPNCHNWLKKVLQPTRAKFA